MRIEILKGFPEIVKFGFFPPDNVLQRVSIDLESYVASGEEPIFQDFRVSNEDRSLCEEDGGLLEFLSWRVCSDIFEGPSGSSFLDL